MVFPVSFEALSGWKSEWCHLYGGFPKEGVLHVVAGAGCWRSDGLWVSAMLPAGRPGSAPDSRDSGFGDHTRTEKRGV